MIIVYSCSKLYEPYLKVSIKSVLKHNPKTEIIIVCKEHIDVPFTQISLTQDKQVLDGPIHPSWEGNAKLFFTQLPYDKIIYLGADTICQGSLQEMWDYPTEFISACKSHKYSEVQAKELNIEYYVNVDSMVFNLKALRNINYPNLSFKLAQEAKGKVNLWCNEETMINYAYHDKIQLLPQKFNYAYARKYSEPMDYKDATIIHFIGPNKKDMLSYVY